MDKSHYRTEMSLTGKGYKTGQNTESERGEYTHTHARTHARTHAHTHTQKKERKKENLLILYIKYSV